MSRAFISHNSADDRYVTELEQLVRSLGYTDVFNDGHTIEPDDKFWQRIEEGILNCDAFVVVMSHSSLKSPWVDREVQFARENNKKVIPIRIDDCKLPASFDGRDVIDLRQGRGDKLKIAASRILRHAPRQLFGRDGWLDELDRVWSSPAVNVYSLIAWGGAGKTSVVAYWVTQRMAARQWPGVERYFDWSFYSQGAREQSQASADLFIATALAFFDDPDPQAGSPWERGERLARLVRRHRTLLVLDGIEPLQYPPSSPQAGELKDEALAALLQGLAMDNPGLCIVTSREALANLQSFHGDGGAAVERKLDKLHRDAAIALLRHLQIIGTDAELEEAWRDTGGHALTLQLLGRFLADAHGGDIRRRKEVHLDEADRETPGRTAMKVLLAYEKWLEFAGPERQRDLAVLRLTGLFDRPAAAACLAALRAAPAIPGLTDDIVNLKDWQWEKALKDLEALDLIRLAASEPDSSPSARAIVHPSSFSIDAHPLVREYFAKQLREQQPEAFCAAHSRLFDYLCKSTEPQPDTVAGLQPLYQAVVHGCLAGRQQEACDNVYVDRILRGTGPGGNFSTFILGAIGANLGTVAAFFEEPWSRFSPNLTAPDQAWLLNEAAVFLRSLGRLTEAVEPMRVGMDRRVETTDWKNAAISASNLSELEVTLGRLGEAVADGRRAVAFADRGGDAFQKMARRTDVADALHQAGERAEAGTLFAEAERMQADDQPQFPLLFSLPGFRYADLILAPAERAAWRLLAVPPLDGSREATSGQPPEGGTPNESGGEPPHSKMLRAAPVRLKSEIWNLEPLSACAEAGRRVKTNLREHSNLSLLSSALDHLTLARARLYRTLLERDGGTGFAPAVIETTRAAVETAVAKLRHANSLDRLPKALLTAALHAGAVAGRADEARRYLDEAQLIAERGPMPLYLADVHLHRARLFQDRVALDQARRLIADLGYGRRREELEDAEAAAAHWPMPGTPELI